MELQRGNEELEMLNKELNDPKALEEYKKPYDNYRVAFVPSLLGQFFVWCGNALYGTEPTYLKFRSIEVIARVPYHSWSSAVYTLLTVFYSNEQKAMKLSGVAKYARFAQDNETMHVVVISKLARDEEQASLIMHTVIPMLVAFFYFWVSYLMYLVDSRYSYELNYLFEQHAFDQYSRFLEKNDTKLKSKLVESDFLNWYGRNPRSQYEFFLSVRNDEIIHRNISIREIGATLNK
jgi:hypothetical protein